MKFYRREPDAALAGMAELTMAERGAYNTLIDLLYARDGLVPDNDTVVARMMSCHWREWRRLKQRLIACGKVRIIDGLLVSNGVCDRLTEAARVSQEQRKNAARRWQDREKVNEINDRPMPRARESNSIYKKRKNRFEKNALWKSSHHRTEEPAAEREGDKDRSQRPTYQELKAKHGDNWGISKGDKP